jgi:hypothetical protein
MIGKIEKVPLRSIWKHEALDFTRWLQENSDVISQAVGFELLNVEREQSTGNFNVDLVAEDSSGHTIIIENQLEKSDHDHLGKIITCLSSFDAQVAVWIVAEPRPEHIGAVSWLNESTSAKFYLLKVEGLRIGESAPAPLLTLIVGPSEAIENAGKTKREKKERHELRKQFWTVVLEKSKAKHLLFNAISPSDATYLSAGAGKSGISFQFWVNQEEARVALYIDKGKGSDAVNVEIFNKIKEHQKEIESTVGFPLDWDELPEDRACIIRKTFTTAGYKSSEEAWARVADEITDAMVSFEKAVSKVLKEIKI